MSQQFKLNWPRVLNLVIIVLFCGVLIALLMPAITVDRIKAYGSIEATNMRSIGTAVQFYVSENNSYTPAKLGTVLPYTNGYNKRIYLSPDSKTEPLKVVDPKAPWQSYAMNLEDHCDYWYVVPNVQMDKVTAKDKFIMLYAKRDIAPGKRNLVFADGHGERLTTKELQAAIAQANLERVKLGLPEIELDKPLKKGP